ncbi:MAG: hypothetical protein ACNYVW_08960 [Methanosarcinales archaeon]
MSKRKGKKGKKKIKGKREEPIVKAEENEVREEYGTTTGMPEGIDAWWADFEKLEVDGKLDLLYNTFAREEEEEFWEDLFDAVDNVVNILASKSRVEEGIKLLETLKEQRPVQYMADYQYYDYYLLHYYAPHGEKARMNEIIKHFLGDPEKGVDHIAVALDIFRLYGMAEETSELSRKAYKKLKKSEGIMSWGIDELNQRAVFCAIREYITSPNYGEEEAERAFLTDLKGLDVWEEEPAALDDEQLQNTVKTLRGEIRRDWKREDFLISNPNYEDNVYLFVIEFIRHLHIEKSLEWVTGDLFFELVMKYFGEIEERSGGFYFSYSKESLDAYLGSYFGFLSLNDAKGMAGLKAHEFFSSFMHQKGITTDKELRKIERVIEELNVPGRKFYERNTWKYRFLEAWK